ncbi:hypothetical protein ACP4OV_007398 [Aristida adscensionis]
MAQRGGGGGGGSDDDDVDPHLFAGVRFALLGFDALTESQLRLEMARCGGAGAGARDADCTHVIVGGILYDDPVCVAARKNGKKVVTEAWVEDSLELGELADADRVLYAPVRDSRGIPGSDSLEICLTGYQKKWREDIMKMVEMMGAQFSKSLRANESTHLICYKFEGDKYDLAKQVNIATINHRWLEDCLKAWEILPIDDYKKSGWELEILEAQVKDSEDETEDGSRGSFRNRRNARSTHATEIRMGSHFDPDVRAPIRGPSISTSNAQGAAERHSGTPEQIKKAGDASAKYIRADTGITLDINDATIPVDRDAHECVNPQIHPSKNNEPLVDQASRDGAKDCLETVTDTTASAICTPIIHTRSTATVSQDKIENVGGKCLDYSNQINVNSVLLSSLSDENSSKKTLHSSEMSGKVDQKDKGHVSDLKPAVHQSNAEEKLNFCESNLGSEGKSSSRNNQILGYSRRRSLKSVSPEANLRSVDQIASPQCFEGNAPRVRVSTPPRKTDQDGELSDVQSLRQNEVKRHVDRSSAVSSSVSPKPPNEAPCSGTGKAGSPFTSKESESEAATVSDMGRNSVASTKNDGCKNSGPTMNVTQKQTSGSFKSNLLSSRRNSLKLVTPAEVEKLPENSVNSKNTGAENKVKPQALHDTMVDKGRDMCPSVDSEVRKESSGVSLQNGDIDMSDLQHINKTKVVVPNSEHDKIVSHPNLEAGIKEIPVNKTTDEYVTLSPKVMRKAGGKRSRKTGSKATAGLANSKSKSAASKPIQDKVVSHENVEPQLEKNCSSPNGAVSAPLLPEEILTSKSRTEAVKRKSSHGPNSEIKSALLVSKVIQQESMKENHNKLCATENQGSAPQKMLNSIGRNSVAGGFQIADVEMADSPTVDKIETTSLKSNSNGVVPPENGEAYPKKLSSSASADDPDTCAANKVPNNRVRKAVAKRKLSAVQKHNSGSDTCKTTSASVSENKVVSSGAAQSSRNVLKVTVDKDMQNTNEENANDAGGSFSEDAMNDTSKGTLDSKLRGSKRQKTADLIDGSADHDKENIPANSNSISKTKYGNNSMSSKSTSQNGKALLDEHSLIEGNDCRALNKLERTWFILSGHRLLRKEYRSILTRLKGRVCRDSHHWSFQATHFITTELRRTEKFFAAAAAGRWILKPDYLTACNEAGKFVDEEPFEWHGHGLNSGDTISLDAPRKWRQLKQRTGRGAFFGMQIIIYGECIAPTLDTLKRTVRAGDGTILATSPPYTRFLKPGVDFAVVSAGIPSVDAWVQEFMRHNIPCISADYLVEYVCKPGHPLTKHVLFNMHDLAEKSFQKLQKSQKDGISADVGESEGGETDVSCSACGSNERAGSMLICGGGDTNRAGCGVGVHTDCCNPPVEAAPDGEWLCPKCDEQKSAKKAKKSAKSRVLKLR